MASLVSYLEPDGQMAGSSFPNPTWPAGVRPLPPRGLPYTAGFRLHATLRQETVSDRQPYVYLEAFAPRDTLWQLWLQILDLLPEPIDLRFHQLTLPNRDEIVGQADSDGIDLVTTPTPQMIHWFREDCPKALLRLVATENRDWLLDDGMIGLTVTQVPLGMEVQWDEHKVLAVFAPNLGPFAHLCKRLGLPRKDDLMLISEGMHEHHSLPTSAGNRAEFCQRLRLQIE